MFKRLFFIPVVLVCALASPQAGLCAWESIRHSDAPLAVVSVTTGAYELAYTVGEPCASQDELSDGSFGLWSGYLSLVPAEVVSRGLASLTSTAAVPMDGGLWGMTQGENLDLNFYDELAPDLPAAAVSVTRLYDNTGALSSVSWPVALSVSGQKLVIVPSASWPKGSVFAVYFSTSLVDINGSPLAEPTTVYFSVIMDHQADNTVAAFSDRRIRVDIPANAYSQDFFVALSTDASAGPVAEANRRLPSMPGSPQLVSKVSISPYDASGNPAQPASACLVTLPYPDADGDGVLDGTARLKASSLSVWRLDETAGLWSRETGSYIDTAARTVSHPVPHFSSYALLAAVNTDLSPVYVSPVPFRPNAGDPDRYGNWTDLIKFRNLPASGRIRIYTITGALVRELPVSGAVTQWDARNSAGQVVASGVYLWEVVSGPDRKTGKLIVIK